jgi:outer membrane protein assembly factor BamD (BamD/ComL family)
MDRCLIVAACALMLVAVAVRAAPTPATSLAEQANAAYQAKDWAQARTLYERLSREQPESAVTGRWRHTRRPRPPACRR